MTLLIAACGSSSAKGSSTTAAGSTKTTTAPSSATALGPIQKATGSPLKVGIISDGKGQTVDMSVEGSVAQATEKFLNERRGGIAGHVVQIVECDTGGDTSKGTDCGNQMVEEKVPVVVIGQSATTAQAWQPLHDAHIPVMIYATNGSDILSDTQSTFVLANPVGSVVQLPLAIAKAAKTKKVAAVVVDVPQATDIFRVTAAPIFKKAGVTLTVIPIPLGTADATPQLQALTTDGTGEVFAVGTDALCITIFNGLRAVGYKGKIGAVAQCLTDATRKAVSGDQLKGMVVSALSPIGAHDPSMDIYNAVVKAYGSNIDSSQLAAPGMFTAITALASELADAKGDLTPETIIAAIKAAPEKELLAAGGLKFQCNGKADPTNPAVCSTGFLTATLDAKGNPISYKASQGDS